jgi:hypothetical protein
MDGMKRIVKNLSSINVKRTNIDATMACVFPGSTGSMVSERLLDNREKSLLQFR